MPEGAEEEVVHRPLPSVGIPLLRDEVRASRMRRLAGLGVILALALAGAVAALLSSSITLDFALGADSDDAEAIEEPIPYVTGDITRGEEDERGEYVSVWPPKDDPDEPEDPDAVRTETLENGDGTRVVRRFGDARAFRPALVAAGCNAAEADALVTALTDMLDFRRCRPSHTMSIERDADGTIQRFEYRASTTQIYEARRDDEGALIGRRVEVPVERIRIARGGTITASLGAALEAAGLGRTLVGTFVETFERQVNFNTQTRSGDTFRILVDEERIDGELLRYGTVHALEVNGQRFGHHVAVYFAPREDLADFYDETGRAVHGGWLRTPLRYDHLSSPFDPRRRHPILRRIVPHNGVDYAAGTGTPVWAAATGTVSFVGPRGANGNLVSIRHANGYESHYAHLSRFASGLASGDTVEQRQVIGYVGSTGRSTGPHLHFGLKRHGRFIDPQAELNGPGRMIPARYRGAFRAQLRTLRAELARIQLPPLETPPASAPEIRPSPPAEPTD